MRLITDANNLYHVTPGYKLKFVNSRKYFHRTLPNDLCEWHLAVFGQGLAQCRLLAGPRN